MVLLGKIALGFGATVVMAGAYTFREGLLRVDVDESRINGSHVHVWLPAAVVPMAIHFVPGRKLEEAGVPNWLRCGTANNTFISGRTTVLC